MKIMKLFREPTKQSRFSKTKGIDDGYMEIYANGTLTNVNIKEPIKSMKNFQGFCACNSLPSGRFAKLQGGYYVLSDNNTWDRIGLTLGDISFETIYNALSKLTNPNNN